MKKVLLLLVIYSSVIYSNIFSIDPKQLCPSSHNKALQFVLEGGDPNEIKLCDYDKSAQEYMNLLATIVYHTDEFNIEKPGAKNLFKNYTLYAVIKNKKKDLIGALRIYKDDEILKQALDYATTLNNANIDRSEIIEILNDKIN